MSHAGVLTRFMTTDEGFEDGWIEVADLEEETPSGSVVLNAIAGAQAALMMGIASEATFNADNFGELSELDEAEIRAFFDDAN